MTLVSKYADWLRDALQVQEAAIPIDLDETQIQSVLDVYQGGWGIATWPTVDIFVPGPDGGELRTIIEAESTHYHIVHFGTFLNSTPGAKGLTLQLTNNVRSPPLTHALQVINIPAGGILGNEPNLTTPDAFLGLTMPMVIPPDWAFEYVFFEIMGGESQRMIVTWQRIPVGFKVV